jgi:hypothetical protein
MGSIRLSRLVLERHRSSRIPKEPGPGQYSVGSGSPGCEELLVVDVGPECHDEGVRRTRAHGCERVAVTGQAVSPGVFEVLEVLGRERTIARLEAAERRLSN